MPSPAVFRLGRALRALAFMGFASGCGAMPDQPVHRTPGLHFDLGVSHAPQPDLVTSGGGCADGLTACGPSCVDLSSDGANCGACGNACPDGQTCTAGACVADTSCAPGQTSCGGACIDLGSDLANCGACGHACPNGQQCQKGQCAAMAMGGSASCKDTVSCLNGCMDQACATGCVNNASPTAKTELNAVYQCLDQACPSTSGGVCDSQAPNYNASQCNTCAAAAQKGPCASQVAACLGGGMMTMCGGGQTKCGNACVNLTTDPANCGACGKACAQAQTCQAGKCATPMMGKMTGCNGAVGCLNACLDSACDQACFKNATTQGQQLLTALLQCLETACPSTNGGVCDTKSFSFSQMKCDTCYTKAQSQTGKCYGKLTACQKNTP